jgi:DNA-binding response OmpR family regulator
MGTKRAKFAHFSLAPRLLEHRPVQTILLVDAPDGDAALLASALRVEGFQVLLAASAAEARAALADGPVTVALVDLMLRGDTGTNGLELARELTLAHPFLRVLLTSAYYLSERQLERADCGVSGFIPKPYDLAEVVGFIRQKVSSPPSSRRLWHPETSPTAVSGIRRLPDAPLSFVAAGQAARR